jgi:hypothetical protein
MDVDASFSGSFDRSRDVPRMGPIISPTAFGIMSGFRVFGGCNNKLKPSWSCLGAGHKAGLLLVGFGRTCGLIDCLHRIVVQWGVDSTLI